MAKISANVPPTPISGGLPPISSEWREFFRALLDRTGGTQGTDVNNVTIKISQISDATTIGKALLGAKDEGSARKVIGAGTSDLSLKDVASSLSGAASASYTATSGKVLVSLSDTGVVPGTYSSVTVGKDGRVTSGSSSKGSFAYAFALGLGL